MLALNILRLALMYHCIAFRNEAILLPGEGGGGGTFWGITWFSGGAEGEWGISRRQQSIKGG